MELIRSDELAERLDEIIERAVGDERFILTDGGKQIAIVSMDDLAFLEEVDRKLDAADAVEAQKRLADPSEAPIPFLPTTAPMDSATR